MQLRHEDAARFLQTHHGVLGAGWKEVQSFEDLEDQDEFEDEEVEEYITLDMGNGMDARYLQTEATFQLIGLDTALPHFKIGNMVLQGEVTPLIGSEIFLGLIRNQENPHNPSHPPLYTTSHRITFRPIDLWLNSDAEKRGQAGPQGQSKTQGQGQGQEEEGGRSMFLQRPAKNGPNRPTVFPGRQRDRIRAEKKAQREGALGTPGGEDTPPANEGGTAGVEGEGPEMGGMDIDPALIKVDAVPSQIEAQTQVAGDYPSLQNKMMEGVRDEGFSTPGAGPSNSTTPGLPPLSLGLVPDLHSDMFATGPRQGGSRVRTGRPRTRPVLEVHSAEQIKDVKLGLLPDNVRRMEIPTDDLAPQSLEFNKATFKRFIRNAAEPGSGTRSGLPRPRTSQSGLPRGSSRTANLNEPYLVTGGTPARAAAGTGGGMNASPLRMEQVPDPPEGLVTEANKDVEGMNEAESRTEEMKED